MTRPHTRLLITLSCALLITSQAVTAVDLQSSGAAALLEHLQLRKKGVYTVDRPIDDWVVASDVDYLIDLVDSKKACMSVALSYSSTVRAKSTVGDEAAFLVEGFKAGRYPPGLSSRKYSRQEKEALKKWWARSRDSFLSTNSK